MPVQKKRRTILLVSLAALTVLALGLLAAYWASQQVPDFYAEAIRIDTVTQRDDSDEMLRQSLALGSDVRRAGQWQALFTDRQLNAYLAVGLVEKHPEVLPKEIRDPRIAIRPDSVVFACRLRQGRVDSVVSLTVEPSLPEPGVLALRIRSARAGTLPLPLGKTLDHISEAARRSGVALRWQQADGDPVALIRLSSLVEAEGKSWQLETLRLGQGEIYVGGTTESRDPDEL